MSDETSRRRSVATDDTGQTTLDYVTGISIFLLALFFIFAFIPGTLQPFTGTTQEEPIISNRLSDRLAQDILGSPSEPFVLDRACTIGFFDTGSPAPAECRYEGTTLSDRLGVAATANVNVTLRRDFGGGPLETACWDRSDTTVVESTDSSCDTTFAAGDSPADQSSTVTAERVVYLYGDSFLLRVVTW